MTLGLSLLQTDVDEVAKTGQSEDLGHSRVGVADDQPAAVLAQARPASPQPRAQGIRGQLIVPPVVRTSLRAQGYKPATAHAHGQCDT